MFAPSASKKKIRRVDPVVAGKKYETYWETTYEMHEVTERIDDFADEAGPQSDMVALIEAGSFTQPLAF